eukprot:12401419-Prorocentrum_lima.AAC.1
MEGQTTSVSGNPWKGSTEAYDEASLAHVIGILRAQLTLPQLDAPGMQDDYDKESQGIRGSRSIYPVHIP